MEGRNATIPVAIVEAVLPFADSDSDPTAEAERVGRRNVTFSPAGGTRVVALTRVPERDPAAQ